ncbi:hypothetical protein [Daejeonella sp.]|uniref:hypothetical protein n=1 Tax=Daejeonella sp. TaxID=2805397 RepID=UPI003983BA24
MIIITYQTDVSHLPGFHHSISLRRRNTEWELYTNKTNPKDRLCYSMLFHSRTEQESALKEL